MIAKRCKIFAISANKLKLKRDLHQYPQHLSYLDASSLFFCFFADMEKILLLQETSRVFVFFFLFVLVAKS